ncbi:Gfo/Idh/MocA family protein [Pseudovibrio ascidiaceicola]|uniref:Gfo/Idh/MocA family protein n=1 Tax=Pseudovibrio ascidiaceicola TaxID=285279 RepID=UPI000D69111C|nr:Gfo/Idh/MocA family oxidoreductase [Pseudovibrio ascidiaceicola]
MPSISLAVVGLGMAAKPHLEALDLLRNHVEVAGLYTRTRTKAEAVSKQYGWPCFDSPEQIASDPEIDAVLLLTPPDQRHDLIELFSGAGKHILTEKPLERTYDAAAELVELCDYAGVKYGVVFQHRFREGAKQLRTLLSEGALGDIHLVRANIPWWRDQAYYDQAGRGTYARDGGGVLITQAIHVLDLMLSLTGPAKSVQAMCATTTAHKMEAEDFATAGIEFYSGAVGSIMATTATYPDTKETLVLDGSKASAHLEGSKLTVTYRDGSIDVFGERSGTKDGTGGGANPMAFPCDWHRDLIDDFALSIIEHRDPKVTGHDALMVHALIEAIENSSRTGSKVDVREAELSKAYI